MVRWVAMVLWVLWVVCGLVAGGRAVDVASTVPTCCNVDYDVGCTPHECCVPNPSELHICVGITYPVRLPPKRTIEQLDRLAEADLQKTPPVLVQRSLNFTCLDTIRNLACSSHFRRCDPSTGAVYPPCRDVCVDVGVHCFSGRGADLDEDLLPPPPAVRPDCTSKGFADAPQCTRAYPLIPHNDTWLWRCKAEDRESESESDKTDVVVEDGLLADVAPDDPLVDHEQQQQDTAEQHAEEGLPLRGGRRGRPPRAGRRRGKPPPRSRKPRARGPRRGWFRRRKRPQQKARSRPQPQRRPRRPSRRPRVKSFTPPKRNPVASARRKVLRATGRGKHRPAVRSRARTPKIVSTRAAPPPPRPAPAAPPAPIPLDKVKPGGTANLGSCSKTDTLPYYEGIVARVKHTDWPCEKPGNRSLDGKVPPHPPYSVHPEEDPFDALRCPECQDFHIGASIWQDGEETLVSHPMNSTQLAALVNKAVDKSVVAHFSPREAPLLVNPEDVNATATPTPLATPGEKVEQTIWPSGSDRVGEIPPAARPPMDVEEEEKERQVCTRPTEPGEPWPKGDGQKTTLMRDSSSTKISPILSTAAARLGSGSVQCWENPPPTLEEVAQQEEWEKEDEPRYDMHDYRPEFFTRPHPAIPRRPGEKLEDYRRRVQDTNRARDEAAAKNCGPVKAPQEWTNRTESGSMDVFVKEETVGVPCIREPPP